MTTALNHAVAEVIVLHASYAPVIDVIRGSLPKVTSKLERTIERRFSTSN